MQNETKLRKAINTSQIIIKLLKVKNGVEMSVAAAHLYISSF